MNAAQEFTFEGMRIISSPNVFPAPRLQVSREFARIQSPELVASTNAWMLEFFGTYLPVYIMQNERKVVMHPSRFAEFKAACGRPS